MLSGLNLNLFSWLSRRSKEQILDDAMEMVEALETFDTTTNVKEMGEEIMMDVVELCMALLRNKNNDSKLKARTQ